METKRDGKMATQKADGGRSEVLLFLILVLGFLVPNQTRASGESSLPMSQLTVAMIDGKQIKLGMEFEQVRRLLGIPDRIEPCLIETDPPIPAIRVIYFRQGDEYTIEFVRDAMRKTVIGQIRVDGGF